MSFLKLAGAVAAIAAGAVVLHSQISTAPSEKKPEETPKTLEAAIVDVLIPVMGFAKFVGDLAEQAMLALLPETGPEPGADSAAVE